METIYVTINLNQFQRLARLMQYHLSLELSGNDL